MPFMYSNEEYADMHFYYGLARGNALEARRLYTAAFPQRRRPHREVFVRVHRALRQTGSFGVMRDYQLAVVPQRDNAILNHFNDDPRTSVRRASNVLNIPRETIRRTLRRDGRHPYHICRVQELLPGDFERRIQFCQWFINTAQLDRQHWQMILWTDEATFTRRGILNMRNEHLWLHENPFAMREDRFQHQFSVNVWIGIINNRLIGPFFLPNRLNGEYFLHFLQEELPVLLEDLMLNVRQRLRFQLDGCPAHYSRPVRNWLNIHYPERWIGRGGPVAWPARSPDLTPLDFFLWGHLKALVYRNPIRTREELIESIQVSCQQITPGQIAMATRSVLQRCRSCVVHNGGHIEAFPRQ